MSIQVSCDCAMTYRLPDRYAGKRCRCRECGESIRVPRSLASESESRESEVEEARRASARLEKKKPARARAGRGEGPASECLHQIAPLPLSEPRSTEPARAVRVAKGALAVAKKAKKGGGDDRDRRRGRDEEDVPTRSARLRGAAKRNRMARRDDDEDEDEEREERRRGKTGKRDSKDRRARERDEGKKSKSKTSKTRRDRDDDEEEDEDGDDDRGRKASAGPTHMQIFLGSLGVVAVSLIVLIGVIVHNNSVKEEIEKRGASIVGGLESAHKAMASQDWSGAKTQYETALAINDDNITDPKIGDARKKAQEELGWCKLVLEAKGKNGSPDGMGYYLKLLEGPDPAVREVGVRLCGQTIGQTAEPPLLEISGKLRDQPNVTKAASEALMKALDTLKGPELARAVKVVLDTDSDPKLLVKAIAKLNEIPDAQLFEKKINELSRSPNGDVSAAAKAWNAGPKDDKGEKK